MEKYVKSFNCSLSITSTHCYRHNFIFSLHPCLKLTLFANKCLKSHCVNLPLIKDAHERELLSTSFREYYCLLDGQDHELESFQDERLCLLETLAALSVVKIPN